MVDSAKNKDHNVHIDDSLIIQDDAVANEGVAESGHIIECQQ